VSDLEFGVKFGYNGYIVAVGLDRDDAISELLWFMEERELREALGHAERVRKLSDLTLVARDPDDDYPAAWAAVDVTEEELDAARELAGEVD
jgi:hypothetical protein